eukprot:COSAG06_NODE_5191_length_3647_cov_51.409526_1_plen_94_part_00
MRDYLNVATGFDLTPAEIKQLSEIKPPSPPSPAPGKGGGGGGGGDSDVWVGVVLVLLFLAAGGLVVAKKRKIGPFKQAGLQQTLVGAVQPDLR